jgi:hypothetical protein
MIAVNVSDEGKKEITLVPVTAKGKATKIDTQDRQPSVEVTNGGSATATVEVNEDGSLKVTVTHGTVPDGANSETTEFKLTVDADMDAGEERTIEEAIVLTTTRAEANAFNATVSDEIPV